MMSDPIADLLVRIKNAQAVNKKTVSMPYSQLKEKITKILVKQGYLKDYQLKGKKPATKQLVITLKSKPKDSVALSLIRISKPGVRIYISRKKLPRLIRRRGITIISTSKGLMTATQAIKLNIGGEIICQAA